jgi:hypothetical protein
MAEPRGGSTPLFDALYAAASLLQSPKRPDVWPVIILFSDGEDTISIDSYGEALQKVLASGTQIYAIDVSPSGRTSRGTRTLRTLADTSGGRYVESGDDVTQIFTSILDDLYSALVVTYALPRSSSDFHAVRILPTRNLNLQFRSVRGYYAHERKPYPEAHP